MGKIIFQDWIVEISVDPKYRGSVTSDSAGQLYNKRINRAVRTALLQLTAPEREFIERFYFQGQSYLTIAEALGRKPDHLDGIHRRAAAKLKKQLAEFVRKEFGIEIPPDQECPLCRSPFRVEINHLIRNKQKRDTWREIMKILKSRFRMEIKTPQVLVSHQKYHIEGV